MKIAIDSKILLIPNGWAIMMTFQLKWWFLSCMLKVSCGLRLFLGVLMFWWSYDRKLLSPFLCYTIFYLQYNLSKINCCFFTCPYLTCSPRWRQSRRIPSKGPPSTRGQLVVLSGHTNPRLVESPCRHPRPTPRWFSVQGPLSSRTCLIESRAYSEQDL